MDNMGKILVIDDDRLILKLVEDTLHTLYEVHTAQTGEAGLAIARQTLPDLILCDIVLPETDGYQLLLQLRGQAETAMIPVVFITGAVDRYSKQEGMMQGAEGFLAKPFTIAELRRVVQTQLEKQRIRREHFEASLSRLRENISMSLPHEIRTAIMVVQGYTTLLMENKDPGSSEYEMLDTVHKNIQRLSQLAEKYLWYIRSNWALTDYERTMITETANEILGNTASEIAELAGRQDDLQLELQHNIHPVKAPPEHMEHLFLEIIDNAFKFSSPGTPVKIMSSCQDSAYTVCIVDRGRGMSAEQIAAIGAFMQFERQRYEQQGTGLGLVIVSQIVNVLGGEFDIVSEKNHSNGGTQIKIQLPLA